MWDIVSKIWLCLLIAAILGFVLGWLLSKLFGSSASVETAGDDAELANSRRRISSLEADLKACQDNRTRMEGELNDWSAKAATLSSAGAAGGGDSAKLQAEIDSLKAKLSESENENEYLLGQVKKAESGESIKQEVPIQICCSLGLMSESQAKRLKAAGVDRVNHNLNTSEAFHASICTTHTFQDRLATIKNARAAGLEICSGGIVGMGEQNEDVIELAMALRDVKPDSIPLNMLTPVSGTPLEQADNLTPQRCLKVLCLFRFLHPRTEIRIAGGREHNLRSLQPLALYPADSVFVNGYLTTPGAPAPEVWGMIKDLGFTIEVDYQQPVAG